MLEVLPFTNATPDQLVNTFKQLRQSISGMTPEMKALQPKDLSTLTEDQWMAIFSNPQRETKLRLYFGGDAAQQAIIEQKKLEYLSKSRQ
jgi:hypothetical protein